MGVPGKFASNQPEIARDGTLIREKLSGFWYAIPRQYSPSAVFCSIHFRHHGLGL